MHVSVRLRDNAEGRIHHYLIPDKFLLSLYVLTVLNQDV